MNANISMPSGAERTEDRFREAAQLCKKQKVSVNELFIIGCAALKRHEESDTFINALLSRSNAQQLLLNGIKDNTCSDASKLYLYALLGQLAKLNENVVEETRDALYQMPLNVTQFEIGEDQITIFFPDHSTAPLALLAKAHESCCPLETKKIDVGGFRYHFGHKFLTQGSLPQAATWLDSARRVGHEGACRLFHARGLQVHLRR